MRVASTAPDDEKIEHKLNVNIPKSPSFHSGLDLVAGTGNKFANISKFNFANDMNGNNNKTTPGDQQQSNQQTIFSFTKVCMRCRNEFLSASLTFWVVFIFQFFTQSNPLNNLNITSSIPPILQRQNSAPAPQHQHQQQNGGDFYKPNNVHKTVASSAPPSHQQPTPSTAGEIHRKYSLPMNTLSSQPMVSTSSFSQLLMRKQSAPSIQSMAPSQQQLQQQPHGSPSRARDRNQFDKIPTNQDVQQLTPLKGLAIDFLMLTYFPF